MKEIIDELESSQSSQTTSSSQLEQASCSVSLTSCQPRPSSQKDEAEADIESESPKPTFEEVEIGNETFCPVPKNMVKYLPTAEVKEEYIDDIGCVRVANNFLYIDSRVAILAFLMPNFSILAFFHVALPVGNYIWPDTKILPFLACFLAYLEIFFQIVSVL